MDYGSLHYDGSSSLWHIKLGTLGGVIYDCLHHGDCFEVFYRGEWVPTRIESDTDGVWYLEGLPRDAFADGVTVRKGK